ncbi:MAG: hypothetical protein WC297_00085 [Candidatus Paceibacterota bacterium]|jgi:hypothetical protein
MVSSTKEKISAYLEVSPKQLEKLGVFDAIIGIDSNLFIDPHLLNKIKVLEFKESRKKLEKYFSEIITLLQSSQQKGDRAWREAQRRLIFHETRGVSIGYGVKSSDGRAIGIGLGSKLIETADEIIKMGIKDPAIFELIGLFEEKFGADRLSDMTISILSESFLEYTERVTKTLAIKKAAIFQTPSRKYLLPIHPSGNEPIIFLPTSLLRDLPVAFTWDDINYVVSVNQELRQRLNTLIGRVWSRRMKLLKRDLRSLIFSNPDNIKMLVEAYKKNTAGAYDIKNDPSGYLVWYEIGKHFAETNRLKIDNRLPKTLAEVEKVVEAIIEQFKKNIEVNGLNEHLYVNGKVRPERFSQRLFFSVADTYCAANNVDLSREPNAGSGPVDFKASGGYTARTLVEIKLSSNKSLISGYMKQIEAYKKSESTESCFYVVIKVTRSESNIKRLLGIRDALLSQKKDCPEIIVIDGTMQPSASRR